MTEQEIGYNQQIRRSYQQNERSAAWARFRTHVVIILLLTVLVAMGYWLYKYGLYQPTDIKIMILGGGTILIITLICVGCNNFDNYRHSLRNCGEDLVHLDLYHSNKEALGVVIEQSTTSLARSGRKIDSMTSLAAETKPVTARYARFLASWTADAANRSLAEYIFDLIQTDLALQGVESDRLAVATFLEKHAPFPSKPEESNIAHLQTPKK